MTNNCWNKFNEKSTVEGEHKRLPDCHPFQSVNDSLFMWLNFNHVWMNVWKQQSVTIPNDCKLL